MLTVQLVVGQVVTPRTAGMKLIATKKEPFSIKHNYMMCVIREVRLITPAMFQVMSVGEQILDSETFLSAEYLIPSCYVHLG
jgi:hypothetical protein